MTFPTSQELYALGSGISSTKPLLTVFFTRNPGTTDSNYTVTQRWVNTTDNTEWYLAGFTASSGSLNADWRPLGSAGAVLFLQDGSGNNVPPNVSGIISFVNGANMTILQTGPNAITFASAGGGGPSTPTTTFYAYLSATQSNVTGNGTSFIIPYNTVSFNINSAFNTTTNRFVAQQSGAHEFIASVNMQGILGDHDRYTVELVVTGSAAGNYLIGEGSPGAERASTDELISNGSILINLAVGDTVRVQVTVFGGTQVVDIEGGSAITSGFFAGALIGSTSAVPVSWQRIDANQPLVFNRGYFCVSPGGALSLALPTTSSIGDVIEISLDGATSWTVTQAAGQQIFMNASSSTLGVGGSISSTAQGNAVRLVCRQANLEWRVVSSMGSITIV